MYEKKIILICIIFLATSLGAGCANITKPDEQVKKDVSYNKRWYTLKKYEDDFIRLNQRATENLVDHSNILLQKDRHIVVTSLANIDDLTKSSTKGRMVGEIVSSKLANLGYSVKEMKMHQDSVYIKEREGEFVLSRNMNEIVRKHDVQAIVVGTYSITEGDYDQDNILVSLRLIDPVSNSIASSACYKLNTDVVKNWK